MGRTVIEDITMGKTKKPVKGGVKKPIKQPVNKNKRTNARGKK